MLVVPVLPKSPPADSLHISPEDNIYLSLSILMAIFLASTNDSIRLTKIGSQPKIIKA
jgi:hypothetical protein